MALLYADAEGALLRLAGDDERDPGRTAPPEGAALGARFDDAAHPELLGAIHLAPAAYRLADTAAGPELRVGGVALAVALTPVPIAGA